MKYGKIIGIGNTATVYDLKDGKVLKLFNKDYPSEAVVTEFKNAKAINNMNFPKPKVYEMINCENAKGIIYDKIEGESLLDWVLKTGDSRRCALYMAELHKLILHNKINNVRNYKGFLEENIVKGLTDNSAKQKEIMLILDKLENGDALCHGDYHPGNIFISKGQAVVIDFMNVCHGHFLYDVARTVYLIEYTPTPLKMENREQILELKKTLADQYLEQMDVTREMIKDYLLVIGAARLGECPNENR
ncbi:aminoglycoside phosphotransferase family protein [Alkaliphilus transvaalensis]|uniref:aminoglycoside phosphotransferase family protein n=1 Tax=Alkaliphilus transvaalensis TaxID=114628 RepID=UPI00047E2CCE|nr:aminoglycoside phosphotransferase family protein [Alkaliphilus transvaalensis]